MRIRRPFRLYDKTEDALLGKPPWEQWPLGVRSEIELEHKRAYRERIPIQLKHPLGDQVFRWLEVRVFSCEFGTIAYYRDVSEQKRPLSSGNDSRPSWIPRTMQL